MNYEKIYKNLISKAKSEDRNKGGQTYYELHHIKPRGWGGSNKDENLVLLTGKEHWLAHLLLAKFADDINKNAAWQAVINMGRIISEDKRKTSTLYSIARSNIAIAVSERHKGTVIVKDSASGIRIGRVAKDHPKVLSGEWIFFHNGMKRTPAHCKLRSTLSSGTSNSRYSGFTDLEILENAHAYFQENGCLACRGWQKYSAEKYGYPQSYSNFRFKSFGGGLKGFKLAMIDKYNLTEENFKYKRTEEHKRKINVSKSNKGN